MVLSKTSWIYKVLVWYDKDKWKYEKETNTCALLKSLLACFLGCLAFVALCSACGAFLGAVLLTPVIALVELVIKYGVYDGYYYMSDAGVMGLLVSFIGIAASIVYWGGKLVIFLWASKPADIHVDEVTSKSLFKSWIDKICYKIEIK